MNKLIQVFKEKSKDILTIYFTAGYPNLEDTAGIITTLSQSGVDIIEVGMPYSDPLADGETIQKSGSQALENGMYLNLLFEQLENVSVDTPLILMGYYNQFLQFGEEKFCQKAVEVGVSGFIFPDMPLYLFEEKYQSLFEKYDLIAHFLITPKTTNERIQKIDKLSKSFIYAVSSASTTGAKSGLDDTQLKYFEKLKGLNLTSPIQIGFGISDKSSFDTVNNYVNGGIIGSAFINALDKANVAESAQKFIQSIR